MMILDSGLLFWATLYIQVGTKQVSHYRIIISVNRNIQRLCSRLTALWRYINFRIIIITRQQG